MSETIALLLLLMIYHMERLFFLRLPSFYCGWELVRGWTP